MTGPDQYFKTEEKRKSMAEAERERGECREALETFSFSRASDLAGPLGEIQFAAWDALRLVDSVRISAIYASDPPPLDWTDPIQRRILDDSEKERPRSKHDLPRRMVALRHRLRSLRDLINRSLIDEAMP